MENTITFNMTGRNGAGRSGDVLVDDPLIIVPCGSSGYPGSPTVIADVTSQANADFVFSASAGAAAVLTLANATFTWTSEKSAQAPYSITKGTQLAVGVACRRETAIVKMKALVKVNVCTRFSEIILRVADLTPTGSQTSYDLSTMSDDTWAELYHDESSAGGWDNNIQLSVTAKGTTNTANVGATEFYIEWIRVELQSRIDGLRCAAMRFHDAGHCSP